MVQIGAPRSDGRIVTTRHDGGELAVRRENLRELLRSYDGLSAGDDVDLGGAEVFFLGFESFDHVRRFWAGETDRVLDTGELDIDYVWLPLGQLHLPS